MNSFESNLNPERSEALNFERVLQEEKGVLGKFEGAGKKARALAAAFVLITAACEKGPADSSNPEGVSPAGKTHIEMRSFQGYGIETRQKVEVDERGNVVRVLEIETPYGKGR